MERNKDDTESSFEKICMVNDGERFWRGRNDGEIRDICVGNLIERTDDEGIEVWLDRLKNIDVVEFIVEFSLDSEIMDSRAEEKERARLGLWLER